MEKTNVMVEFKITGDIYSVNDLTDNLKVMPSKSWVKGDIIAKNGKERGYTCWAYSTGYEESYDINTQLKKIYETFFNKRNELIELKEKYNLNFSIDIVIKVEKGEVPAMHLDKELIEFAYFIDATYDFDMYIY